jgi:uncharacterized protein (TIGR03067 family)
MGFQLAMAVTLFGVAEDPTKELDKLQGTWVLVGGAEKGRVLTEEEAKTERESIIIKGDTITVIRGRNMGTGKFRLDPSKKPAWMDLIDPDNKGQVNHAIYRLEGDRLTICVSRKFEPNKPEERPVKFTTKREDNKDLPGLVMGIYMRQKKERPFQGGRRRHLTWGNP